MFKKKIAIEKDLFERASEYAREKGYTDLSEWVADLMAEEMSKGREGGSRSEAEDEVKKRLQGLGYIS